MKEVITELMIASFIASCAQELIPEGGIKSGAEKLISFAAIAAALVPAVKLFINLLKGGR